MESKEIVVANARTELPDFFHDRREDDIMAVFEALDANDEFGIDLHEISPFVYYVFKRLFGVELNGVDVEALFHLIDANKDTIIGYPEFVCFVIALKRIEKKCKEEQRFAEICFGHKISAEVEDEASKRVNLYFSFFPIEPTFHSAWFIN